MKSTVRKSISKKRAGNIRNIAILGDSIIKDIQSHKMKADLPSNNRIYLKSFRGATTTCMHDYIKPSLKFEPDLIIIHSGTNNVKSEEPKYTAKKILELAEICKTANNEVVVSSLIARQDNLNDKVGEVNRILATKCRDNYFIFCDNSNISEQYHLNASKLHLNRQGTAMLAVNFIRTIKL